jgi:hypothetical protein
MTPESSATNTFIALPPWEVRIKCSSIERVMGEWASPARDAIIPW